MRQGRERSAALLCRQGGAAGGSGLPSRAWWLPGSGL